MKLIVSRAAAVDLERVHSFLAKKNPAAATRAAKILVSAIQSLDTMPERGRPSGVPNTRELIVPFGRSAYVLRYTYSIENHEIVVLRVWHGREARGVEIGGAAALAAFECWASALSKIDIAPLTSAVRQRMHPAVHARLGVRQVLPAEGVPVHAKRVFS